MVEKSVPAMDGPDFHKWERKFDLELDNIRAGLEWWIAAGDGFHAVRGSTRIHRYWSDRGYQTEGRNWIMRALACSSDLDPKLRATGLKALGMLSYEQADLKAAKECHEEALRLNEAIGNREGAASTHNDLGGLSQKLGEYEAARWHFQQALDTNRELGLSLCAALNMGNLGGLAADMGNFEEALRLFGDGLEIVRRADTQRVVPGFLSMIGSALHRTGELERAEETLKEGLALTRAHGNRAWEPSILNALGTLALDRGELSAAGRYLREGLAIAHRAGSQHDIAGCLEGLAEAAVREQDPERATTLYSAANSLRRSIRCPLPRCNETSQAEWLQSLRERLGVERFDTVWAEGRKLPQDRVLVVALE
jgi:tetratricopeptide (TPR) repeat protein